MNECFFIFGRRTGWCALIIFALLWSTLAQAKYQILIPREGEKIEEPTGIYMGADFEFYPKPIDIDFRQKSGGEDWQSVLVNESYAIYTGDKEFYIQLHTDKDGGLEAAKRIVQKAFSFGPDVDLRKVELIGMVRWGRLINPMVNVDVTPDPAGPSQPVFCEERCWLSFLGGKQQANNFLFWLRRRHKSALATAAELAQFEKKKADLQHYVITPSNPVHQTPENESLYPNVYLDLQTYAKRWRFLFDKNVSETVPEQFRPILELFSQIKSLDKETVVDDDAAVDQLFLQAFTEEKITKARLPLFIVDKDYEFRNRGTKRRYYAEIAWRYWDGIIPVGYLQHGNVRFIYFYPWVDEEKHHDELDKGDYWWIKGGKPIVQFLPVHQGEDGYQLSFKGLWSDGIRALQYPEAIALASDYFGPADKPWHEMTTEDMKKLQAENLKFENKYKEKDDGKKNRDRGSERYFILGVFLIVLLASICVVIYRRRS